VERLDVDPEARQRLTWILATLSGDATVAEACEALGIGESRFHEIRERALSGAAAALVRGRPGRPPKREEADPEEVAWLEARVAELEEDVAIERARAELATGMPHLLRPRGRGEKTDRARRGRGALRPPDTSFLAPKPEGAAAGREPEEPGS
jgi:hypothetical protein